MTGNYNKNTVSKHSGPSGQRAQTEASRKRKRDRVSAMTQVDSWIQLCLQPHMGFPGLEAIFRLN